MGGGGVPKPAGLDNNEMDKYDHLLNAGRQEVGKDRNNYIRNIDSSLDRNLSGQKPLETIAVFYFFSTHAKRFNAKSKCATLYFSV